MNGTAGYEGVMGDTEQERLKKKLNGNGCWWLKKEMESY